MSDAAGAEELLRVKQIAELLGVTRQAIEKSIRVGRLQAYDLSGNPVSPDARGHKFVKRNEAARAFRLNRARVDDDALDALDEPIVEGVEPRLATDGDAAASPSLLAAKTQREALQADLLRMRLARERGDLVARQAVDDALETAGREVARKIDSVVVWAEEIAGAAMSGGVGAVAALLRAKVSTLKSDVADGLIAVSEPAPDASDAEDGDEV